MKTIQNVKTGAIRRVYDHEAETFVEGSWRYIPKYVWKNEIRDKHTPEVDEVKEALGAKKKRNKLTRKDKKIIKNEKKGN